MADPVAELLKRLETVKGDTGAQAALAAEFALITFPEEERQQLRDALDVAAVLRCFNDTLLGKVLDLSPAESLRRFNALKSLPFVERYRTGESDLRNVHESTRLGWRKKLDQENREGFRDLSARAAACFVDDTTGAGSVDWIYHLLCADPDQGSAELENLESQRTARPYDRYALTTALRELEELNLLEGRARVCVAMSIAWTRVLRGETAQLLEVAEETLALAKITGDERLTGEARCLIGEVQEARGNLNEAQKAHEEFLAISKRLAEQEPDNPASRRRLAVAYSYVGGVLAVQGNLRKAQAANAKYLAIMRELAEQYPSSSGCQRDLTSALGCVGGILEQRGKLNEAQLAYEEYLSLTQKLIERDPGNEEWQWDLALAYSCVGRVLQAQGKFSEARSAYERDMVISTRLVDREPGNAGLLRDLAIAHFRIGGVLQAQRNWKEAQTAYGKYLAIIERLVEQDPANAGWLRDMAEAHERIGEVFQMQGKLSEAQLAYKASLDLSRRLTRLDPANVIWQNGLAVTLMNLARAEIESRTVSEGLQHMREAKAILETITSRSPERSKWKDNLDAVSSELKSIEQPFT